MIRKTFKLLIITAAVIGGTGFLMFGTDFGSYLGTMARSVQEGVEEQIPIELQLKRAEQLIREVDPQVKNCKRDVARAEIELRDLLASVETLEQVVAGQEVQLKKGADRLRDDGAVSNAAYLGRETLTRRRVERDLQRKMDSYRNNVSILATKRKLVEQQSEAVEVAKQRLVAVTSQKEELLDMIASLRTQKQWVETMAAGQKNYELDDSALGEAKAALAQIKKRLDVKQKMLENEVVYSGEVVFTDADADRDVLAEIDETFGGSVLRRGSDPMTIVVESPSVVVR